MRSSNIISDRLALYHEAGEVAHALRSYCEEMQPQLSFASEEALSQCVTRYSEMLETLKTLNDQIASANESPLQSPEDSARCERLRCLIRADLEYASSFKDGCALVLEDRCSRLRSTILQLQKRKRLSAYLQSPLIGQEQIHYERHD